MKKTRQCVCCGVNKLSSHIQGAHVKDRAVLTLEHPGIDDRMQNIIELCAHCHLLFDNGQKQGRMGIKIIDGGEWFVYLDEKNAVHYCPAKKPLNVRKEYIVWKNKRVVIRLWKILNRE